MPGYIFRPPASAVGFSWKLEDVLAWLAKGGREMGLLGARSRNLGTTLHVRSFVRGNWADTYVRVTLYDTDIARIYADRVEVGPVDSTQRQATLWWISHILSSNVEDFVNVESFDFHYRMVTSTGVNTYAYIPIHNTTIRRTTSES